MAATPDDALPRDGTDLDPRSRDNVLDLERHLLACCLRADAEDCGIDDAEEIVTESDFSLAAHGVVFAAARECRRERQVVMAADVYDRLRKTAAGDQRVAGVLPDLGSNLGLWLGETLEMEPTGFRARYYATYVREASLFRQLRGVAAEISRHAVMPTGPAAEVLGECERLLFDLTDAGSRKANDGPRPLAELVGGVLQRIDDRIAAGGRMSGLPTGYTDLDQLLGGMRPGQMIVVGARPGAGKTALSLNVANHVAALGLPVTFFSLEMPYTEIVERLLSMGSGVPMHKISRGSHLSALEAERLGRAGSPRGIGGSPISIDDSPDLSAGRLASKARREVRRNGSALLVVDYLQLMRPENPRDNRTQQVGLLARRVKQVARECGVPVLLLCQLNRESENRPGKPKLSDLRESGEIEQHADAVMLLSVRADQPQDDPVWVVDVVVAKNRNGPVGDVALAYRRPVLTFENAATDRHAA